jgi:hypothetical protein
MEVGQAALSKNVRPLLEKYNEEQEGVVPWREIKADAWLLRRSLE